MERGIRTLGVDYLPGGAGVYDNNRVLLDRLEKKTNRREKEEKSENRDHVISIASGSAGTLGETGEAMGTPLVPFKGRIARFLWSSLVKA